jgi:carboxypeptidase Q
VLLCMGVVAVAAPVRAQTFTTADPVLQSIWTEGTENSQLRPLAHTLLDSIGPRLVGTPQMSAAHEWAVRTYAGWGISARNEAYGSWLGWQRGHTHIDMVAPRQQSLTGRILAWSPGTQAPVAGEVAELPVVRSAAAFEAWLPEVRGKWVMISFPQPTCRPDDNWQRWATGETLTRMRAERTMQQQQWELRLRATGLSLRDLPRRLEDAGAAGVLTSNWATGWGANRIFNARTRRVPTLDLSCEDYGLLHRLVANGTAPVVRVDARSEFLGDVPAMNTIAEIRGSNPEEYVVLSAHFDSWDGATGATDNGTGTVTMMEAMRILRAVYPNPRRTILVGHWGGEEQGLNGSRAFVADNPNIVRNIQVVLNQDNGTGRVSNISMQGFTRAGDYFTRWLQRIPTQINQHIELEQPGTPSSGGSDHASFVCAGVPAFMLSSLSWDYFTYTWHTNLDTFDKIAFDDVRNNAILVAMLAYLASEEPRRVERDRVSGLIDARTGQRVPWPACAPPDRSAEVSPRM